MTLPRFPKVPTPLEGVDAGLDVVAEVVTLPARVAASLGHTIEQTAQGVGRAIAKPKDAGPVPAPPDVIVGGALEAATSIAGGVVDGITGVVGAFQQTGEGVKAQIDALVKR